MGRNSHAGPLITEKNGNQKAATQTLGIFREKFYVNAEKLDNVREKTFEIIKVFENMNCVL